MPPSPTLRERVTSHPRRPSRRAGWVFVAQVSVVAFIGIAGSFAWARTGLVDPDTARRLVTEELSRSGSGRLGFFEWLLSLLLFIFQPRTAGGEDVIYGVIMIVGITAVVVMLVLLTWGMLRRYQRTPRAAKKDASLANVDLSPGQYRQQAATWRDSDPDAAVKAAFRAVVAELETQGAIMPSRGRTSGEIYRTVAVRLPHLRGLAARGAQLFDLAAYDDSSQQRCTSSDVDEVLDLSSQVGSALASLAGPQGTQAGSSGTQSDSSEAGGLR